jgi:hypothetical protein
VYGGLLELFAAVPDGRSGLGRDHPAMAVLALAAAAVVAAQAEVGAKTNEVPMAAVVLGQIDLTGKIVTADAMHTMKATARHIHEHGRQFVLPITRRRSSPPDDRPGPATSRTAVCLRDRVLAPCAAE